ncbi:MAG: hypothetical protein FWH05_01970 [Oscillospiraceae bacterium]|nr:hypothetical protein [Oscillospiraceae bacterium]
MGAEMEFEALDFSTTAEHINSQTDMEVGDLDLPPAARRLNSQTEMEVGDLDLPPAARRLRGGGFEPLNPEELRMGPKRMTGIERKKPIGTVGGFAVHNNEREPTRTMLKSGPGLKPERSRSRSPLRAGKSSPGGAMRLIGEFDDGLPEIEMISEVTSKTREEIEIEGEMIKQTYINEGIQAKNEAKGWADKMVAMAKTDIAKMYAEHNKEYEQIKADVYKTTEELARKDGYADGNAKGYEEGYATGLRKCKETMQELVAALEDVVNSKDQILKEYKQELFNSIFTISNKIIADSLKQRDKAVITKMLQAAAKGFRNSEYVKITLSKLDVDIMSEADMDCLRKVFRDTQHIEFEISKDAPSGTMILDNGSEITDAGTGTQLNMIKDLAEGKFKDN